MHRHGLSNANGVRPLDVATLTIEWSSFVKEFPLHLSVSFQYSSGNRIVVASRMPLSFLASVMTHTFVLPSFRM